MLLLTLAGLIVIAHDDVPCSPEFKNCTPPYYRMDPHRWPDVPAMVQEVARPVRSASWSWRRALFPSAPDHYR